MKASEAVSLFRAEMHDDATPPLWPDELLYVYLDDAQKEFARLTGGISDSSSSITDLVLAIGDTEFELDERILKVRRAYNTADGVEIPVINQQDMIAHGMRFDGATGSVRALVLGMDDEKAYPYPIPNAATSIRLTVDRLPLEDVKESSPDAELEIKKLHQLHLLKHMKMLAYDNADAEVFNKAKAREMETSFREYCARAVAEKETRKRKIRVVKYGGISMSLRSESDY